MMLRITIILYLWVVCHFSSCSCSVWNVQSQQNINPLALNGRWWTFKWRPPSDFNYTRMHVSYVWDITYNPEYRNLQIIIQGRLLISPRNCTPRRAILFPYRKPGVWKYLANTSQNPEYETIIAATDYVTYLALVSCVPRFQKGCGLHVAVRTRVPFVGPKLRCYLDKFIKNKLHLNPREFVDSQRLSSSFPVCQPVKPKKQKGY